MSAVSIFKKSFFEYRSSAQKAQDYEKFQEYMFPYGEAQRKCAERVLEAAPKKTPKERMFFLFLVAKERYIERKLEGCGVEKCREDALKYLQRFRFAPKENLAFVYALAMLDLAMTEPEEYPTAQQVYSLSQELFPENLKNPNWSVLP